MYYFLYHNYDSKNKAILSKNEYERDVCDNCGAIHITYKGKFNFRIMGKLLNYYLVSGTPVISERFLNVLMENRFTGFEVSETAPRYGNVTMEGDLIKEKYYLLKVTGRCGPVCDMNGEPLPHCRKCGGRFPFCGYISNGVSFDSASYDESDIFSFENMSNIPIVSEDVKDILIKSKLTNLNFEPLNEMVLNYRTRKETAFKSLQKGTACDELIEAWLKYGVLTEQELNEQLSKNEN